MKSIPCTQSADARVTEIVMAIEIVIANEIFTEEYEIV